MAKFEDVTVNLKLNYDIQTTVNGKEIHQVISSTDILKDKLTQISNKIYNTSDEQFRNALIGLGWKPPEE